jgi:hypothetical protein
VTNLHSQIEDAQEAHVFFRGRLRLASPASAIPPRVVTALGVKIFWAFLDDRQRRETS